MGQLLAINKATINAVFVEKTQDGYEVYAQWDLKTAQTEDKAIWLWVREGRQKHKVTRYTEADTDGSVLLPEIDPDAVYDVGVSSSESEYDEAVCTPVPVLFEGYEGVRCTYDGRTARLCWQPQSSLVVFGELCVQKAAKGGNSPATLYTLEKYTRSAVVPVEPENYDENMPLQARLTPYVNKPSSGPQAFSGYLLCEPARIVQVDVNKTQAGIKITAKCTQPYDAAGLGLSARLALLWQGREVARSDAAALDAAAFTLEWTVADAAAATLLEECILAVWLCSGTTENALITEYNTLPLAAPDLSAHMEAGHCVLRWRYAAATDRRLFAVYGPDGVEQQVAGYEARLPVSGPEQVDKTYTVRLAGACIGPSSGPVSAFTPGYYLDAEGRLLLCQTAFNEETIHFDMSGICTEVIPEAIVKGPLSLATDGALSITKRQALAVEELEELLEALVPLGLVPEGYYRLRAAVARCASCVEEDRLALYGALRPEENYAALFPGASVLIQAGAYSCQTSLDAEENAGVIQGAAAEYPVSLRGQGSEAVLCMDPFFHTMRPAWQPDTPPANNTVFYGGGLDLFCNTVRQPYYRLWFPARFPTAASEPTPFFSDNLVLLAAPATAALDEAVERLTKNPTLRLGIPNLVANGRSFISIRHTVLVNGAPVTLPVGATLGDLLAQACGGSTFAATPTLRRATPFGPLPVHLLWMDENTRNALPLLPGDRIEV